VDFGATLDEDVADYRQFIDQVYQRLTTEGYDHRYEWIADGAGARYAYRAGYDPRGLVPFLQQAAAGTGAPVFEAHKTHPDPSLRLQKLRDSLATLGGYTEFPRLEERYEREVLSKLR
jgi:predicted Zn-dependent protease